jgi:uncharacterized protein YjbI with pentapeptide repeats
MMTSKKKAKKEKAERTCGYKMHDVKTCGRELYDGEYCIFHSIDIEGKKEKFNDAFWKEFERQKDHEKIYDFTGFVFPVEISFTGKIFEKDVHFMQAKFSEKAYFVGVQFGREAVFENAQFSGVADFYGSQFSGVADFAGSTFVGNANFEKTKFSKESNAYFKDAKFKEDAYFKGAVFSGNAEFTGSKFSKDANFGRAEFSGNTEYSEIKEPKIVHRGNTILMTRADVECVQTSFKADFNGAEFSGKTNFTSATFHGCAEFEGVCFSEVEFGVVHFCNISKFSRAKFKGEAIFQDAVFRKYTSFLSAEFSKYTSFRGAKLRSESNFESAKFYEVSVFEYSEFCNPTEHAESSESSKTASFLKTVFYGNALFNEAKFFGVTTFQQAVFNEVASFKKTEFHKTSIFGYAKFNEDADFSGVIIKNNNSFNMQYTYFFNVVGLFEYIEENDKVFKPLRKISKTLKTKFISYNFLIALGERAEAKYPVISRHIKDDMYLLDKKERISKLGPWRRRFGIKRILFFIWWLFANYGRSFKRWASWSIGFAFLFALIYTGFYGYNHANFNTVYVNEKCPFLSFLYYSIVTFTTLGFGDIVPRTDLLQFLVALEVILGYIMLGGLISILANKMARRS